MTYILKANRELFVLPLFTIKRHFRLTLATMENPSVKWDRCLLLKPSIRHNAVLPLRKPNEHIQPLNHILRQSWYVAFVQAKLFSLCLTCRYWFKRFLAPLNVVMNSNYMNNICNTDKEYSVPQVRHVLMPHWWNVGFGNTTIIINFPVSIYLGFGN